MDVGIDFSQMVEGFGGALKILLGAGPIFILVCILAIWINNKKK